MTVRLTVHNARVLSCRLAANEAALSRERALLAARQRLSAELTALSARLTRLVAFDDQSAKELNGYNLLPFNRGRILLQQSLCNDVLLLFGKLHGHVASLVCARPCECCG